MLVSKQIIALKLTGEKKLYNNNVIVVVQWKWGYSNAIGRAGKNPERRNSSIGAESATWKRGCQHGVPQEYSPEGADDIIFNIDRIFIC